MQSRHRKMKIYIAHISEAIHICISSPVTRNVGAETVEVGDDGGYSGSQHSRSGNSLAATKVTPARSHTSRQGHIPSANSDSDHIAVFSGLTTSTLGIESDADNARLIMRRVA